MTIVQCTLVVPVDQALLARALWSELGLDDFEFVQVVELSATERLLSGPVSEVFASAVHSSHTLHRLATERGMDLQLEELISLCSVMRVPIS